VFLAGWLAVFAAYIAYLLVDSLVGGGGGGEL
jgi:hypothetical protein